MKLGSKVFDGAESKSGIEIQNGRSNTATQDLKKVNILTDFHETWYCGVY